jgi:hypothetical protein
MCINIHKDTHVHIGLLPAHLPTASLPETTVEILAVLTKSEADSWLAQFGSPE